jgi:CubicO group peptidase (beta-lactamase class C family)
LAGAVASLPFAQAAAQTGDAPPRVARIDAAVQRFMTAFEIPGVALAIVAPGVPDWARGYGVRTLGQPALVDVHTRFAIASNTKAFTAAALALLVEAGKLGWEDPVRDHLPEFRMADPLVTQMMTVHDLLCHDSGLPLGAGDLMYIEPGTHVAADALKALPYLKLVRGFRTGYDYDNILYIVAGLLIEKVSGLSWREMITTRILQPLGMDDSVASRELLKTDNVAGRHARLGPPLRGMGKLQVIKADEPAMFDPAAGINASAFDLTKWLRVQLGRGVVPDHARLWSETQSAEMWRPRTIIGSSDGATPDIPTIPVLRAYALGWFVQDYRSELLLTHSGALHGQKTETALLPARGLGTVILTNTEDGVTPAMRNAVLDALLGAPEIDWVAVYQSIQADEQKDALATFGGSVTTPPPGGPSLPLARYAGRYRDPWYGDVVVEQEGDGLRIDFVPTPTFKGALQPWGPDAFRTHFTAVEGADAVVMFHVENGKVAGVTMRRFSPLEDFSLDFEHLALTPVT